MSKIVKKKAPPGPLAQNAALGVWYVYPYVYVYVYVRNHAFQTSLVSISVQTREVWHIWDHGEYPSCHAEGRSDPRGVCCGREPKFPKGIFISMVWHDVVNRPGNQGVLISPCQGVVGCMPNLQGFIQVEGNPIRSKMYFLEDLGHTIFSSKTHPHRDQPPTHPFGLWPGSWKQAQETNTG